MSKILINPPPSDHKCYKCGKKTTLHKTFRCEYRDTDNEQIGASWECKDCVCKDFD